MRVSIGACSRRSRSGWTPCAAAKRDGRWHALERSEQSCARLLPAARRWPQVRQRAGRQQAVCQAGRHGKLPHHEQDRRCARRPVASHCPRPGCCPQRHRRHTQARRDLLPHDVDHLGMGPCQTAGDLQSAPLRPAPPQIARWTVCRPSLIGRRVQRRFEDSRLPGWTTSLAVQQQRARRARRRDGNPSVRHVPRRVQRECMRWVRRTPHHRQRMARPRRANAGVVNTHIARLTTSRPKRASPRKHCLQHALRVRHVGRLHEDTCSAISYVAHSTSLSECVSRRL